MSEIQPINLDTSLNCQLCWRSFPASEMAIRSKLNFCQTCASQRSAECLARLQGGEKPSRTPSIAVGLLCLGAIAGTAWWTMNPLGSRGLLFSGKQTIAAEAMAPAVPAAASPSAPAATPVPSPVPNSAPISSKTTAEEKPPAETQPAAEDRVRRSVEDAGQIHLLFVTRPGTDSRRGMASLLFVTREAPNDTSAKLVTEVGKQMETSFDEGLRYVRKQPRDWEKNFSIRLSFEDKFTSKDGGSAGTGFTVAMLAAIQEIALDPDVAMTGDLTVDGTVQPVGAVVEKLQGALESKCKVILIPERNSRDVVDFTLLTGTSPLWDTQIFSIGTIDQALGLARKDRAADIKQAMARFDALRARLPAVVTPNYLQSPIVQSELQEIVRLAPNHLSAATLLHAAQNQLPRELSLNRSVNEILATSYLFVSAAVGAQPAKANAANANASAANGNPPGASSSGANGITVFPEREFDQCLKNLQRINPILDPRSVELKSACMTFSGALRAALTYQPPDLKALRTRDQMIQVLAREKGFIQQTKDDLEQARSRLLLALRKLDTDGSLVTEMMKK
jgi:hypothetical protein